MPFKGWSGVCLSGGPHFYLLDAFCYVALARDQTDTVFFGQTDTNEEGLCYLVHFHKGILTSIRLQILPLVVSNLLPTPSLRQTRDRQAKHDRGQASEGEQTESHRRARLLLLAISSTELDAYC